jgi:hypothetical protein
MPLEHKFQDRMQLQLAAVGGEGVEVDDPAIGDGPVSVRIEYGRAYAIMKPVIAQIDKSTTVGKKRDARSFVVGINKKRQLYVVIVIEANRRDLIIEVFDPKETCCAI